MHRGYPTLWYAASNRNWANKLVTMWTDHPNCDINIHKPITATTNGGHVLHWSTSQLPLAVLKHPKININVLNNAGESILDYAIKYIKELDEVITIL